MHNAETQGTSVVELHICRLNHPLLLFTSEILCWILLNCCVSLQKKRSTPDVRKPEMSMQEFDALIAKFQEMDYRNNNLMTPVSSGE